MSLNTPLYKEVWIQHPKPQALRSKLGIISQGVRGEANLPGTGDTVIKQAVPPGGDSALHLALLKPAIAQNGWLGCTIFGRGGLRSRIPRTETFKHKFEYIIAAILLLFKFLGATKAQTLFLWKRVVLGVVELFAYASPITSLMVHVSIHEIFTPAQSVVV